MSAITVVLIVIAATMFYFAPSFVAAWRRHRYVGWIAVGNALFGWTLFVWFMLMLWAVLPPARRAPVIDGAPVPPDPDGDLPLAVPLPVIGSDNVVALVPRSARGYSKAA